MIRDDIRLVDAMIPHVASLGWGDAALWRGAEDAHMTPEAAQLALGPSVPRMLGVFLEIIVRDIRAVASPETLKTLKIKERMTTLIMGHLHQGAPYKSVAIKTMKLLVNPLNSPLAWTYGTTIIDTLWRQAGDTSTDFNYYTKRLILMKIYGATLVVWLKDRSENHKTTQRFLEKQLDLVLKMSPIIKRIKALFRFQG